MTSRAEQYTQGPCSLDCTVEVNVDSCLWNTFIWSVALAAEGIAKPLLSVNRPTCVKFLGTSEMLHSHENDSKIAVSHYLWFVIFCDVRPSLLAASP